MADAQGAESLTVPKGEFAAICGVTAGRVSQWISEGKITAEALEGEGPRAKVRVQVAQAQLRSRLDVGQRFGNGLKTRLRAPLARPAESVATATQAPPQDPDLPAADNVDERIKREKLAEIERRNREQARKELAARGEYVRADDVKAGFDQVASGMINVFEGALGDLALAVAARFEVPQRDVLHLLRGEFRKVRANAAQAARKAGETLPAVIEDDPEARAA